MAKSHTVDVHVGARMRQRRVLLGMSQTTLGTTAGLTYQQIQKYERGANRIGSSRLYEFAEVLDVSVSYFFDDLPSDALPIRPRSSRDRKGLGEIDEALKLVRAHYQIREDRARKSIFEMIKAVGAAARRSLPLS